MFVAQRLRKTRLQEAIEDRKDNPASRIQVPSGGFFRSMVVVKSEKVKKSNAKAKTQPRPRRRRRSIRPRDLLKIQRELVGLTREQLAERAGVTAQTIEKAEAGTFDDITPQEIVAIGVALGASMASPAGRPKPPAAMEDILRELDRLLESKRGKAFLQQQSDKEHASVFWDIVGDPQRNWLYVVVSNPTRNARFAAVTDDPGGWAIGGQLFGMDVETGAIAEELSNKLFREHKAELLA